MKKIIAGALLAAMVFSGCTPTADVAVSDALVPNISAKNVVEQNPYLPDAEAMIHNDVYNSDVTNRVVPLGIYPEIYEGVAQDSPNSPPAFFYDVNGNAICPYSMILENGKVVSGGVAIRDVDSDTTEVLGSYMPALDEGAAYGIQISYSFVDAQNNLVGPTTNGHVVFIRTSDADGNVLKTFEKILDVDVVTPAIKLFGDDIDQNLLSIVFDYEGNLWFVTGGFHKNPAHSKAGFAGYLDREYIDACISGDSALNVEDYLHYTVLEPGENAENGIAAHSQGCVILTNLSCHLFSANDGVQKEWSVAYESSGGKAAVEGEAITGAGLAWGGGSSPTLTNDLVLFTDNQDTVNLIAVDIKTGEVVCTIPVLDLGEDVIVSVENSICVYDGGTDRIAVYVCNWYGAGNASLFDPTADSSVQSYANLYDANWMAEGASYLMPGVERVDIVKQADGSYTAETVWTRADLKDTSMMKYSTGVGYFYGYLQDATTGEWGFIALDANSGETALWVPVSDEPQYNNIAVGIMQGNNGNTIYCPTNSQVLLRMYDRFAYLPDYKDVDLDLARMERKVRTPEEIKVLSGQSLNAVSYEHSATLAAAEETTLAFRVNGLTGKVKDLTLLRMNADGRYQEQKLTLTTENGEPLKGNTTLQENVIYEIRVSAVNDDAFDLDPSEQVKATVLLTAE